MIEGLRELLIGLTLVNLGALGVLVPVELAARRRREAPGPGELDLSSLIEQADAIDGLHR